MRTKAQDRIDRRKLLEREKAVLYPHLMKVIDRLMGDRSFDIEHIDRDRSFRMACWPNDIDMEILCDELNTMFGATVEATVEVRGDGCCEHCYSESDMAIFKVSSITKNWPTEELAKLAPRPR